MGSDERLAFLAIIAALRQSGAIDKRAVGMISAVLRKFATQSGHHCLETADSLNALAELIDKGPRKTCLPSSPTDMFAAHAVANEHMTNPLH